MALQYVATTTFFDDNTGRLYEAGGIYDHKPRRKAGPGSRVLRSDEHVAACPRCGQQFAATEDGTAEANRDLHFYGDDECPSICGDSHAAAASEQADA